MYKGDYSELHGIYCRLQLFYHPSTGCPAVVLPYYCPTTGSMAILQTVCSYYHSTTAVATIVLCSSVQYTIVLCSTMQHYTEHRGIYQYYRHYGHSHRATIVL